MAAAAQGGCGSGGDTRLDQETARWLQWDKNPLTSEFVKQLIAEGNTAELQRCFGARMEFGTAGLRAAMGAGVARMNDLTIIQTTQVPRVSVTWSFSTCAQCYEIHRDTLKP
ncbi:phosphoglucomutase 2 [Phyllostomus discolor]|uniref:Phosphoglucomutase 2 n=1 Tax=Phyllostomus discolor TaxID=89673 RepID=A0A834ESU4_9CHIR|nr:phosphoglucomutase 2 [Phyllostomus discolor]